MQTAIESLPVDATGSDRMRAIGRSYRSYSKEQPELYLLTFGGKMTATAQKQNDEDSHLAFQILLDTVGHEIERGDFMPMPPAAMAFAVWASVHGFVMLEISGFLDKDLAGTGSGQSDRLFEASLALIEHGLLRR